MTSSTTGHEEKAAKTPSSKQYGSAQPEFMERDKTNKSERD